MSAGDRAKRAIDADGLREPRLPGAYALVVLLAAAASVVWVFLTPLGSVPDEPSHAQYAAAVVRGQTGTSSDGVVTIPGGVATGTYLASCTAFAPIATTRCQSTIVADTAPVTVAIPSAGYPPLYFAIVGIPTLAGFDETTWYLMRLLSVAIGIGLLAAFIPVSRRWPTGWLATGVLLAVTPMASYLVASVNPNGAEIFAGLATSVGIGLLMVASRSGDSEGFVRAATPTMLALSYLILARPRSYLLAAGLVTVAMIVMPRGTASMVKASGRRLAVRAALPALALVLAILFENLTRRSLSGDQPVINLGVILRTAASLLDDWVIEMVGIFGWRDFRPPTGIAVAWLAGILALAVMALAAGRWRDRVGLAALIVGGTAVAPVAVLLLLFRDGAGYQGRYQMPLTVGITVLAAATLAAANVQPGSLGRRLAAWAPWGAALLYALVWGGSVLRYGLGLPVPSLGQLPQAWDWWLNPFGSALLLGALASYAWLSALLSGRLRARDAWVHPDQPDDRLRLGGPPTADLDSLG